MDYEGLNEKLIREDSWMTRSPASITETNNALLNRIEDKYLVSKKYLETLTTNLTKHLKDGENDTHVRYNLNRTTYLDTKDLDTFKDAINDVKPRFKFRIRQYAPNGKQFEPVAYLELKIKTEEGLTKKTRIRITDGMSRDLASGKPIERVTEELTNLNRDITPKALMDRVAIINSVLTKYGFREQIKVQYERRAYSNDSLRITIDDNVTYYDANSMGDTFKPIQNMPNWGKLADVADKVRNNNYLIVEVKHELIQPEWVTELLKEVKAEKVKFSKYCAAIYNYVRNESTPVGFITREKMLDVKPLMALFDDVKPMLSEMNKSEKDHIKIAAVVLRDKNFVLVGRRSKNDKWGLPGGKFEDDETKEDVALRELEEETGIKLKKEDLKYEGHKTVETDDETKSIYTFSAKHPGGEPTSDNDPDEEFTEWQWIRCENGSLPSKILDDKMNKPTKAAFEKIGLKKSDDSEYISLSNKLLKGKVFPIGTVRNWGGQNYAKHTDGWVAVTGEHKGKLMGKFKGEPTHKEFADKHAETESKEKEGPKKENIEPKKTKESKESKEPKGEKPIEPKVAISEPATPSSIAPAQPAPKTDQSPIASGKTQSLEHILGTGAYNGKRSVITYESPKGSTCNLVGFVAFGKTSKENQKILNEKLQQAETVLSEIGIKFKTPIDFVCQTVKDAKFGTQASYYPASNTKSPRINISKSGSGLQKSLMHEIGHALDYSMAETSKPVSRTAEASISRYNFKDEELSKKYAELLTAVRESKYYEENTKQRTYLNKPTEIFARAFEVYSFVKGKELIAQGKLPKDYLENFTPDIFKTKNQKLTELQKERTQIHNKLYSNIPLIGNEIKDLTERKRSIIDQINKMGSEEWINVDESKQKEYETRIVGLMDDILKKDEVRKAMINLNMLNLINKLTKGGPGSGIRGHMTTKQPSPLHPAPNAPVQAPVNKLQTHIQSLKHGAIMPNMQTKSGKPIVNDMDVARAHGYTEQDHVDAMNAHHELAMKTRQTIEKLETAGHKVPKEGEEIVHFHEQRMKQHMQAKHYLSERHKQTAEATKKSITQMGSGLGDRDLDIGAYALARDKAHQEWLEKLYLGMQSAQFGDMPTSFPCEKGMLHLSKVDDGLYSGYFTKTEDGMSDNAKVRIERITLPELVQLMMAKEWISPVFEAPSVSQPIELPQAAQVEKFNEGSIPAAFSETAPQNASSGDSDQPMVDLTETLRKPAETRTDRAIELLSLVNKLIG